MGKAFQKSCKNPAIIDLMSFKLQKIADVK